MFAPWFSVEVQSGTCWKFTSIGTFLLSRRAASHPWKTGISNFARPDESGVHQKFATSQMNLQFGAVAVAGVSVHEPASPFLSQVIFGCRPPACQGIFEKDGEIG